MFALTGKILGRCRWAELLIGMAVLALGWWLGGPVLPALGAFCLALSAGCAASAKRRKVLAAVQGVLTLAVLGLTGVNAFFYTVALSRYYSKTSPLVTVLVAAACLLGQVFLTLPTEDRRELLPLRRALISSAVLCGGAFLGIVLTYLLALHYAEGAVAVALALSGGRVIWKAFTGGETMCEPEPTKGGQVSC